VHEGKSHKSGNTQNSSSGCADACKVVQLLLV